VRAVRSGQVVLLALMVLLTACAPGQPVTRSSSSPVGSPPTASPAQPTVGTSELASEKAAAQIADCPASSKIAPVEGGLPDVTLECLGGGRPVNLSGVRGTPMVINIWAQWCPPCREESPHLTEVSRAAGDTVLFLGVDYLDPYPDLAIDFARQAGWRYPQVVDPEGLIQVPLRVPGPPISIFVAADGRIVYTHTGPFISADQLRGLIRSELGVRV